MDCPVASGFSRNLAAGDSLPASELVKYCPALVARGRRHRISKTKQRSQRRKRKENCCLLDFLGFLRCSGVTACGFAASTAGGWPPEILFRLQATRRPGGTKTPRQVLSSRTLPFDAGALRAPAGRRR